MLGYWCSNSGVTVCGRVMAGRVFRGESPIVGEYGFNFQCNSLCITAHVVVTVFCIRLECCVVLRRVYLLIELGGISVMWVRVKVGGYNCDWWVYFLKSQILCWDMTSVFSVAASVLPRVCCYSFWFGSCVGLENPTSHK